MSNEIKKKIFKWKDKHRGMRCDFSFPATVNGHSHHKKGVS